MPRFELEHMAELLYRLGKFSARKALLVISIWLIAILGSGAAAVFAGGKLSSSVTLDGIPSQDLVYQLQATFPDAGRGVGQAVFHKADSVPFTDQERAEIAALLAAVQQISGVNQALDPFDAQASLDKQRADLAQGAKDLAQGQLDLVAGQDSIDEALAELSDNKAFLVEQEQAVLAGIDQLSAAGLPGVDQLQANLFEVQAGLAQIQVAEEQLAAAQDELDAGKTEALLAQRSLDSGAALLDAASGFGIVSSDGLTALANIYFDVQISEIDEALAGSVVSLIKELTPSSVQVEFSQSLVFSLDGLLGIGEVIGLLVAALVLIVMLRTFIGAGLPVIAAIAGVAISAAITFALSSVIEMTSTTPLLGIMLGLAVGIDYSLFILNRHRRQLKSGIELHKSIGLANGTSGNAVVFAGVTVIIALLALNLTGVGFLGLMGSAGALSIVVAVLVALSLVPAVLGLAGMRVLTKSERAKLQELGASQGASPVENTASTRPVLANRHPILVMVSVIAALGILAIPASSLRLALPDGGSESPDSTANKSYNLIADSFGAGANGNLVAIAQLPESLEDLEQLELQATLATELSSLASVASVLPAGVSESGTELMFAVIPEDGPTSESTEQLVFDIRDLGAELEQSLSVSMEVTGIAAINIDMSKKLAEVLPLYLGTVILLSLVLLIVVFRSLLVPLIATGGFLLTVFATLGAVVAVYQWGWLADLFGVYQAGPLLSFLPTILIGITFGLAMDYQLFLVSGMREAYVHGKSANESINYGMHLGRAVVVAAAIIMIAVFGGFAFSHLAIMKPMGFGLAMGVLIDAFLVRLLLMPAVMTLLGKSAWWIPQWLDRLLPDVDVEGAKLERSHIQA